MATAPRKAVSPVEVARRALKRLSELGLSPTPENYQALYCAITAEPVRGLAGPISTPAQALELVRTLMQAITVANDGLHADLAHFSEEAISLLAESKSSHDTSTLASLYQAMNPSSTWLLGQVDEARRDLAHTREQLHSMHLELERQQELATTDALTALPNRRGILIILSREFARARRSKSALCLAMLDIDHFKHVNDHYGHSVGDRALRHFAETIRSAIRETDELGRFSGAEFLLILPATNLAGAEFLLNRLLIKVERTVLHFDDAKLQLGFSAGLAPWAENHTPEGLIERADKALYRAKHKGRGRVECSDLG